MWQIWIDTGGTFTDGLARDPEGNLHRTKVLSSSCLRGVLKAVPAENPDGEEPEAPGLVLEAPWLTAPIFDGYRLRVIETGETGQVVSLNLNGKLLTDRILKDITQGTVELSSGEEAPVLATRLLTLTPLGHPFPPLEMRLGTTRGTNALLERKGGRVALVVTKGFRDLLTIGTQQRPELFQLAIPPADTLYDSVWEAEERMTAEGAVLSPLTAETIQELVTQVTRQKPDAVAVSFLNAWRNPQHEIRMGEALREAGFPVTLSTGISSAIHYLPRTRTAVVNAYLTPVLRSYLQNLTRQLQGHPVWVMTSAGGLVRAENFLPKDSLLSGPAGGVIGAASVVERMTGFSVNRNFSGILTLDMGGTSTDVARYAGRVDYRFSTPVGPFELQSPSLAVETVAAGGGSVCRFDGSQLRVGPESAGASPGPACYGAGGPLTITDVNLLLGRLHPARFGIPVDPEKAREALRAVAEEIREKTGEPMDEAWLLAGFERIANEAMAGAIRKISVARGFDPKEYGLLVFGGAGGLHGCAVARLLGMRSILLPFDGGLLSAYGIGKARIERMAARQILLPLAEALPDLPGQIRSLTKTAVLDWQKEQIAGQEVGLREVMFFLRFQGQESTIEIRVEGQGWEREVQRLEILFREKYENRFGHYPAQRVPELESLRVLVGTPSEEPRPQPVTAVTRPASPAFYTEAYPVFDWTRLEEGDSFKGPALLLNRTSSAFIEPGWEIMVKEGKNVQGLLLENTDPNDLPLLEAAQTELFARRFTAIAEEMGVQLQRTAFSVNVKERLDFSCALLDASAELLVNAPHIPVHLGSLGICTRLVLDRLTLGPGDVVITNHPKYGGSHLPDVTLLAGVFTGKSELVGYVINRAHHAEIGGKVPGSMPPDATRLVEEGVVLEPQYLVKNGELQWAAVEKQFTGARYPTRSPAENRADIDAALASLRTGEIALKTLVNQHGLPVVHQYMKRLKQSATDTLLDRLSAELERVGTEKAIIRDATEKLDDGHSIQVKIVLEKAGITFDFAGTSPVHPHNLNANRSILFSAVLYVLRLWCGKDLPLNEGLMVPVTLHLPECFLNPSFSDHPEECPAVVGGNTEVSQRLVDTLLKALGTAACSQGTMNNFLFGNAAFGYYETIGGGAGAGPGFAGRSAVHQHMTNTRMTDPEELERRYPVRLHEFSVRQGSGGKGQWDGGDGIVRELEFLQPVQTTLLSQHRVERPYGLAGGEPGQPGRQWLIRADGSREELPGIFSLPVQAGERIRLETPGGGGFGEAE
ncbi:hydantoinase B/oxoprolinase family protein [Larkinella soli]|uniref:hydantoinase B/oxoprolinase family protein n=1 Tax=Larkinella soli TaxID=1770527 RepID=UPI000FFBEB6D|nr:hydantoinase B/oxoprolinase family protein [Larkinella soli]